VNPRALTTNTILTVLHDLYTLQASHVISLSGGADMQSAVYRVETESTVYVLKIRHSDIDPITLEAPAYLHTKGIDQVMGPLPTAQGRLWANAHGVVWILYPFFAGADGYEASLTNGQWITLSRTPQAVHSALLPPKLRQWMRREDYSPRWRDIVRDFTAQLGARNDTDPLAQALTSFWAEKRSEIGAIVEQAEQLGRLLLARLAAFVLCHGDLHPGNVLLGAGETLCIVDWNEVMLAPKERDLMLLDGGVSRRWNDAHQDALFFEAMAYPRWIRSPSVTTTLNASSPTSRPLAGRSGGKRAVRTSVPVRRRWCRATFFPARSWRWRIADSSNFLQAHCLDGLRRYA
jgi:spectinomycin phosphotransferase